MNDFAVKVNNLGKCFKIYSNPWLRGLEWISNGRIKPYQEFWALRNVSFELKKGECLGVIGANGAGKSTLLKVLTRALYPTTGTFQIQGSVLSLLELGTGFNEELTGRQNIYRSSKLLGFPEGYVKKCIKEIEDFADLGPFFDRSLKTYSSGMYVRLAFSMFVFLEPEVLIIDEVLSVGDIFFQQKCFKKLREMLSNGTTCLFASHDMEAVRNLCQRVILLDHGEIDYEGPPEETVSRYISKMGRRRQEFLVDGINNQQGWSEDGKGVSPSEIILNNILKSDQSRHGARGLEVVAARVTNSSGESTMIVPMLKPLRFDVLLQAKETIHHPQTGIHLYDRFGNLIFAAGTPQLKKKLPKMNPGQQIVVSFEITFNVQPGEYTFTLGASEPSQEGPNIGYIHDRREMLGPIVVTADPNEIYPFYGIAKLPMKIIFCQIIDPQG